MAVAGITLTAQVANLRELQDALGKIFTNADKAAILEAAIEKAIYPAFLRLKETTPKGPTGNLKAAATYKVKSYPRDGNAVGLIGYRRAGRESSVSAAGGSVRVSTTNDPDRGFHQWWLENGTQPRQITRQAQQKPYTRRAHQRRTRSGTVANVSQHQVKGQGDNVYYASSFNRLGPFKIIKDQGRPDRVQTDPSYPRAFFRKSKTPITIPAMPVGGWTGRPPLQTAWDQTRGQVAEILQRELRISLQAALDTLTRSATGSITD
jgi:hypothetical protein